MDYKLREWRIEDAKAVAHYANNINVAKFLTDAFPHPYTEEDGRDFITKALTDNEMTVMAIEIEGEPAGGIGIHPQQDIYRRNAELGYWLAEKYWGRGIMTKAVREMVEIAFRKYDIDRIFARPFSNNPGSQRVLEKAGFRLEGRFEKTLIKNDEYLDELIYAIRREGG